MSQRAYVYVDGFNLYNRCLKKTPYKWLDLVALARHLLPRANVVKVKYFTARISARPADPDQAVRQQAYISALKTLPSYQRLVLDPLRLIRIYPLPAMQIRLILLVIPLSIRDGECSSGGGAVRGVVPHTLRITPRVVPCCHALPRDNASCHGVCC